MKFFMCFFAFWCLVCSSDGKAFDIDNCSRRPCEAITSPSEYYDGFGSQFQHIIWAVFYAEAYDKEFVYTPFFSMEHNYDDDPDFLKKKEDLINFLGNFEINSDGRDVRNLTIAECKRFCSNPNHIKAFAKSKSREKVKRIFKENKKPEDYFDVKNFNIAVHIRRFNPHDGSGQRTDTPDEVFYNTMQKLRNIYSSKQVQFHIYSQGDLQHFKDIYNSEDVVFHINESVEQTFASMVFADALIMSCSAMSYAAGILSEGDVYYTSYPYPPLPEWEVVGTTGE